MDAFKDSGCVPDVIEDVPAAKAEVRYPAGAVEPGAVLTPTQVQDMPAVSWPAEEGALYTLVLTDPDAPSRADPKFGEWRHWLVVNIAGTDVSSGDVLSVYVGAGPPPGTGLHRYIILVFKQPSRLQCDEPVTGMTASGRNNWKARDFAVKYCLGRPVAANFFLAEYDDYVPQLYAKLK